MKLEQPIRIPIRITQKFRANPKVYKKFGLAGHDGLDYGCPTGTKLYAPMAGTVYVGWAPKTWGLFYSIENDWGTVYLCHLKENYMSTGSKVMKEQLMGETDNTGFSTGPHLHIGLRVRGVKDAAMKDFVDPLPYFEKEEEQKSKEDGFENKLIEIEKAVLKNGKMLTEIIPMIRDLHDFIPKWQKEMESANKKVIKLEEKIITIDEERRNFQALYKKKLENDISKATRKQLLLALLSRLNPKKTG